MPFFSSISWRSPRWWVGWMLALAGVIALGGILWWLTQVYQSREENTRHQIERELHAISALQTQSVLDWREQRMIDAETLVDDSQFSLLVAQWLQAPSTAATAQESLQERLRILQERAKYTAVYLLNPQGALLLTPGGSVNGQLPALEMQAMQEAGAQAVVMVVEPHRDPFFAFPFFSVIVPLFQGTEWVGSVWLVSDVRTTLYPKLQAWPTPRETAESTLFSRHGNEVRTLNPLRYRTEEVSVFQLDQMRHDDPVVQAMAGARGVFYGHDYQGHAVMAMANAVPDSPWMMVSKIDVAEAFADTQLREILALSLPVSLLLLLAGLVFAYVQRRAWQRERKLKTQLQHNMRWLEGAQKAASVGYFAFDPHQERFLMSSMACEIFGLPAFSQEISLDDWMGAIVADDSPRVLALYQEAIAHCTPLRTQYSIHRYNSPELRWVEVWGEYEAQVEHGLVARMIGTVQDITERKQSEQELANYRTALEEKVRLDPMTQIPNRRALDEHVVLEWHRAMRNQTPLSLLMIDVDHFKAYNDHYGHVAGDECLRRVAAAIARCAGMRSGELAARYGGEEFAVLLPHNDAQQASQSAERVRAAVEALALAHAYSSVAGGYVTVSVGAATIQPVFAPAPEERQASADTVPLAAQVLFEWADAALYQAKQQGRNRTSAYEPPSPASEAV